jgi:hypothetical protein
MSVVSLKIQRTPYTYILEWVKENKRYIGVRWAKGCHPGDLWSEYFTSSEYVKEYVRLNGKPDIILIDRVFYTPEEAMRREQELQYKYNVRDNPDFLNKNIAGVWNHNDPEIKKKRMETWNKTPKKHTPEWIAWVTEFHRTRPRSPETNRRISAAKKGVPVKQEHRLKCGNAMRGKKHSLETLAKMSESHKGNKSRTGQTISEETKEKMRASSQRLKNKVVTCPHCDKVGGEGGMIRWHFDNCRSKK